MNVGVRPTECLEVAELRAIKAALDLRRRDHVRLMAIVIVLSYGLRQGEVRQLKVRDFCQHQGEHCLHCVTLKQRSGRVVKRMVPIMNPADVEVLLKYIRQEHGASPDSDANLFRTAGSRFPFRVVPLTPRAIDIAVKTVVQRAGIKRRITPHSFRHGLASGLLRAGVDVKTVSEVLGHSSIAVTERYLHTPWDSKVEGLRRIAGS